MKNIKILVVTHKPYAMPADRELYLPIQSGCALYDSLGLQRDDEGDNISLKNPAYNELCPMYWAWKNLDADAVGMCHYRRIFADSPKSGTDPARFLTKDTIKKLLDQYDIILPPPRKYYHMSVEQHYCRSKAGYEAVHQRDMAALREALRQDFPDYVEASDTVLRRHQAHMWHMCIMSREKYDAFCDFMFSLSLKLEELLIDRPDKNRYIGGIAEFFLDIWIEKNQYPYYELGVVELEHRSFLAKCVDTYRRRFFGNNARNDQANILPKQ